MQKTIPLFLSSLLFFACSGKKDAEAPSAPMAPAAPGLDGVMEPGKIPDKDPTVSSTPAPPNPQVRALTAQEELTCQTMCGHLAWCNQKVHQKTASAAALSTCVTGCGHRRSESDKGRWAAMEGCLKQHRSEDCAGLRGCIDAAMLELQQRLHGMEPTPTIPETKENP